MLSLVGLLRMLYFIQQRTFHYAILQQRCQVYCRNVAKLLQYFVSYGI